MLWNPPFGNCGFEVKSYYKTLQTGAPGHFPWKNAWKVKALLRDATQKAWIEEKKFLYLLFYKNISYKQLRNQKTRKFH